MRRHGFDRTRCSRFQLESLEGRSLMTGGFGNQFAEVYANISTAGGTTTAQFTIDPSLIKRPRGTMVLGIDVSSDDSTVQPTITAVQNAQGRSLAGFSHATYAPTVSAQLDGKTQTSAILVDIPASAKVSKTYTVQIAAQSGTSGALQLGFFLPGDVSGSGTVTRAGLKTLQADEGSVVGDANYGINADSNRNGKIDKTDLAIAKKNLGVSTAIVPTVTASITGSSTFNAATRTATAAGVTISGTATPGALIQLTEIKNQIPKVGTVADSSGNFQLTGQLAAGTDTLHLTATDSFGQSFDETMLPITYKSANPV